MMTPLDDTGALHERVGTVCNCVCEYVCVLESLAYSSYSYSLNNCGSLKF